MTQIPAGDWPIDPALTSGIDLSDKLNLLLQARFSGSAGPSRPPGATAGMIWVQKAAGGPHLIMLFDGSTDREIARVGTGGVVSYGNAYTKSSVDQLLANAKAAADAAYVAGGAAANAGVTVSVSAARVMQVGHAQTSGVADSSNSGGTVIQSLTFDSFGHVAGRVTVNLDSRYYTKAQADAAYQTQAQTDARYVQQGSSLAVKAAGLVTPSGVASAGSTGVQSVTRTASGRYAIVLAEPATAMVATPSVIRHVAVARNAATDYAVTMRDISSTSFVDTGFSFICV